MSHRARAARAGELFIRIFPGALRESKRAQPRKPTTWPLLSPQSERSVPESHVDPMEGDGS